MKIKLFLVALCSVLLFSFVSTQSNEDKKLKNILIGSWSGSESGNQIEGVTKYWIQNRHKNGTYILMFTAIENCEATNFVEKGKWWVKDGMFYEKHEGSGKTDSYLVEVFNNDNLKFKAKSLSLDFENKEYEFTETREE